MGVRSEYEATSERVPDWGRCSTLRVCGRAWSIISCSFCLRGSVQRYSGFSASVRNPTTSWPPGIQQQAADGFAECIGTDVEAFMTFQQLPALAGGRVVEK